MAQYTLIEYMPEHLRASHTAARNSGVYPHNGAERLYIEGEVDSRDLDPNWASVIEDGVRATELPEDERVHYEVPAEALRPYDGDEI